MNRYLYRGFPKFYPNSLLWLSKNFPKNQNSFFWFRTFLNRLDIVKDTIRAHFRDAGIFGTIREKISGMPILMSNESSLKIKRPCFRRFCQKLSESPENAVGKFSGIWNFDFWLFVWYEVGKYSEIHNLSIFWCCCHFRILLGMSLKWFIFGTKWISGTRLPDLNEI